VACFDGKAVFCGVGGTWGLKILVLIEYEFSNMKDGLLPMRFCQSTQNFICDAKEIKYIFISECSCYSSDDYLRNRRVVNIVSSPDSDRGIVLTLSRLLGISCLLHHFSELIPRFSFGVLTSGRGRIYPNWTTCKTNQWPHRYSLHTSGTIRGSGPFVHPDNI